MSDIIQTLQNQINDLQQQLFLAQQAKNQLNTEFKQLDARKDEMEELKHLAGDLTLFEIDKNSYNESYAKVLILFECYLK